MIRISTTTLEAFRRVLTNEYPSEAELIAQIKVEPFKPTWQMEAGSAWDEALSTEIRDSERETGRVEIGKFSFDVAAVDAADRHIGPGVWQVKATKYSLWPDGTESLTVAQVDHIRGLIIQENKAKFSTPDARDYEQSLQWRFYLWVHGAAQVRYNLFDFADPKGGYCELRNIVSFNFWSYPGLEADCRRWVREFLDWAGDKKLLGYLDRESSTPVAA